jgi:LEA14-like dessication related protein
MTPELPALAPPALMPRRPLLLALPALLAGCAVLSGGDPPKVSFAGVEALSGEGMELRFTVKLRVQNPADAPLEIDGLSLNLAVRGMDFASGVSPVKTTVPRFGETVLSVPVTVPATALLRQAWAMTGNREVRKIEFELSGRLGAGPFGGSRFASQGELDWPPGGGGASKP